jgi:hypothetical protein
VSSTSFSSLIIFVFDAFQVAQDILLLALAVMQTGALPALLRTVMSPEFNGDAAQAARAAAEGSSPAKIALFTIGNMCAHRDTRWVCEG